MWLRIGRDTSSKMVPGKSFNIAAALTGAGPAAISITGATLGVAVKQVLLADTGQDISSAFEKVISVVNQVQQLSAANYSGKNLVILTLAS